jgi:hypothetical protein
MKRGFLGPLAQNAIDSIECGVEDFSSNDEKRAISSIRNYYAGLLLLFKAVICNKFPEVAEEQLLAENYRLILSDEGIPIHTPKGYRTIDFHTIKERLKALEIKLDNSLLNELDKL